MEAVHPRYAPRLQQLPDSNTGEEHEKGTLVGPGRLPLRSPLPFPTRGEVPPHWTPTDS